MVAAVVEAMRAILAFLLETLVWAGALKVVLVRALSDVASGQLGVETDALAGEMLRIKTEMVSDLEVAVVSELGITSAFRMVVPEPMNALFVVVLGEVVGLLTDALPFIIIGIFSGIIFVHVLIEVEENGSIAALAFATPKPLRDFSCWVTCICLLIGTLNGSQAWIPSCHVCLTFVLPGLPQFLYQAPPRPQQLIFPDFAMMPHLGHHREVVKAAGVKWGHESKCKADTAIYSFQQQ